MVLPAMPTTFHLYDTTLRDGAQQEGLRLSVSDTGVGLPQDFETRCRQSLGMQLVSDLARQLGGTLHIGTGPGSEFAVLFARQT